MESNLRRLFRQKELLLNKVQETISRFHLHIVSHTMLETCAG